jgi:hypothetical protein
VALTVTSTTTNASLFKTIYDTAFGKDPTEESVIAGYVAQPLGGQKIGKEFVLRKLQAYSAQKYTGTSGLPANLTNSVSAEAAVTSTMSYAYIALEVDEPAMTRVVEDGAYRAGIRAQALAGVNSQVDADLFALNASLSSSESGADIDDAMLRSALKQLATNAKGKFKLGKTPVRLFINPTQIDSVLGISTIREYQIRGSAGSAPSGQMVNAYGISFAESGNLAVNAGNYNNALLLPDAFAIGYNIKPSFLPEQQDGILTRFIVRAEYAVVEWFDSSGVKLVTT